MRTGRLLRTATFRRALIYMAPFGVLVVILFGFLYLGTLSLIDSQANATIEAEIRGLAEQYGTRGLSRLEEVIAERSGSKGEKGSVYLLTGPDLTPLAGNLNSWPSQAALKDGWLSFEVERNEHGVVTKHEIRAKPFRLEGGFRLLVGRDMAERAAFQEVIGKTLAVALVITVILGVAGAVYLSRRLLVRVEAIAETSRTIVRGDLTRRVPLAGSGDEFDHLSASLNEMLEQIEQLMTGMRAVTDSLAHDLRSPLTRLKGRIETVLRATPDEARYRETLAATIADADAILGTFNALLAITEAEAGTAREGMSRLELGALARAALELYEPLAEGKGLILSEEIDDGVAIVGHPQLLAQSVANLLDNAIKYTAAGGAVSLAVRNAGERAELVVADSGPGIPPEDRARVLERFVRLDASRSSPGSGLGLSLVAAVAKLHRAELRLEDNAPGLKVILAFETADSEG
ncbi:MAG TPA: HAMP domain-containing sensor histidine kinase [Alphaproteobacteria bacterium]|nr:HAMP domain-containing sensor histidine kinase [Alphaproteobacteria bacterium]